MTDVEVWAQADILNVRTTLVPLDQASALETMLLKAIRAGADHKDDLCDVFGLAPRLVEGTLGDLWRAGRISIELGTDREVIKLTSGARKELDELAERQAVTSSADRTGSEKVAHDRLTGRVLPWQASRRFLREHEQGLVVPTMADDPDPADLRESDLAEAVTRSLNWWADDGPGAGGPSPAGEAGEPDNPADRVGNLRIDTAYLAPALLQASRERRYVPLRVQAFEDAAGSLTVRVTDDRLPLWAREQAARRLQGLIADRPALRFVTQLKQHAQHTLVRGRDLSQLIAELRSVADALPACDRGNRQREHDRATALGGEIDRYTEALALTEMDVTVIATSEQHRKAIVGMLQRAERQVVIAVPWVKQGGVLGIRDALIAAVGRGIQITLLWGITSDMREPDSDLLANLDEIERHARASGRGGELRYHRTRGARSHAKVVVADDRELLVSSKNFLSASDLTEAGLLLTAPPGRPGEPPLTCPVILEVLRFVYDHIPDPATAFKLIHTREGFGPRRDEPSLPPVPLPRLTAAVLDQNAPPEHARAWAAAWQEAARALADRAVRSRPTVEVIKDGQHAALVREALEEARHRVLITSHRVSKQALTDEVCALAADRAAQGLDVAVRYGVPMDDESAARLTRLGASPGLEGVGVRLDEAMHAKVVLRDDSTVLGSFNHLSVDAGVRARRATGELSVRIASAAVADEVWAALLGRSARPPSAPPGAEAAREPGVPVQLLLELLEPPGGLPDVDALAALAQAEGADRVLAAIRRMEFGAGVRRRVLAAAALPVLAGPGQDRDTRLAALMPAVWKAGAWACADQVRRHITDPGLSPRAVLTGALADPAEHARVTWAAAMEEIELTAAEAEVLAVSACVGLLLGELTDFDAVDLLRHWKRPPAPRSDEFVAAAADYLARYAALPAELPDLTGSGTDTTDLGRPREALRAALDSLRRYDSHSQSGDAVRDRLFASDGEMAELAAALAAGDAAGLRAWEKTYADTNDARWLIKATKTANQPVIDDHRKTSFIGKHRAIRVALRDLNAALAEDERTVRPAELPPGQAAQLRRLHELIVEMVASLPPEASSPEETALASHLARLRARLSGQAAAARPGPGASLDSWALPQVAVLREAAGPAGPAHQDLLEAVCRDLAVGWTSEQAVRFLLGQGEYGLADRCIDWLRDAGLADEDQESALREQVEAERAAFADELDAQARAVGLRCDRADLDADDPRWQDIAEPALRRAVARDRWAAAMKELDKAEEQRRRELTDELAACRAELRPDWAEHIDGLIEAGELALAQLALTPEQRNGRGLLPQAVQLSPWSWRSADLARVAAWFEPGCADVPPQVCANFLPDPADEAAARVVNALRAVAARSPEAAAEWLAAVQSLIVETDAPPTVRHASDNGVTGDFMLPYDVRLPRLCWVARPPGAVTVGETSQREMLHFSLDLVDHGPGMAVISVSDVLALLGRDSGGRPASMTNRALRFLGMVSSQLPLDRVIAPHDTPAEHAPDRRMALAWLLWILGFYFTPADLDMLRLLGGGHQVPLWHLIAAARTDPVQGIRDLRDRPDLDTILVAGLVADLGSDTDLLILCTVLMMDIKERASLAEVLALVWEEAGEAAPAPDAIDLDAVLGRLIGKRYLIEEPDGRFGACGCAVVRAQRRTDLTAQVHRLVKRVNATLEVSDLMFSELLSYARHAEQADADLRSPEEQRAHARRNSEMRMADRTPFDLCLLCTEEARRADMMRDDVDVFWDVPANEPLWLACRP